VVNLKTPVINTVVDLE